MSFLPDSEKTIFDKIWDACSDMTGYVQMHFASKNNELRESIFGSSGMIYRHVHGMIILI